jgi:hypothetical protein
MLYMFNFVSSQSYRNEVSVTQTDNNWCGLQNYNDSDVSPLIFISIRF